MTAAFRYRLFAHVVDRSGAADQLKAALRTSPRGRRGRGNPRTFLILLLLAAADGELTVERMHQIGTRELPRDIQQELGTVRADGDSVTELPIDELYYLTRTITRKLAWTGPDADQLPAGERDRRRAVLEDLIDRLVQATLPDRPGSSYALDESAIWAWAKGRKPRRATAPDPASGDGEPAAVLSACPDARWGVKTGKNGEQDAYFGYALHALVRVPDLQAGPSFTDAHDPTLIEAIAVTPAATDVVDVSLALLDRTRARRPIRDLIADRHYSYKEWSRWARALWERGIHPVLDLREDEHGFRDHNGVRIAASWPHCPATPPRLATIPRPGPGAAQATKDAFADKIRQRQAYAMRRVKSHVPDGASRWECPARAGKLGCPLVDGSVQTARDLELPIVTRPPRDGEREACCTQRTFMIRVQPGPADAPRADRDRHRQLAHAMKHAQDEYWGDHRWLTSWTRRTYVEGAFGNLKNPNTENVHRGLFRFTGLPLVSLAVVAAVCATNIRQLRNWHQRTGNGHPNDPLLAPEPEFHGFLLLPAPPHTPPADRDQPDQLAA
jgi:hypothetical protein